MKLPNKKNISHKFIRRLIWMWALSTSLYSCEKQVEQLPGNSEGAALNFFPVSDVIGASSPNRPVSLPIVIDDDTVKPPTLTLSINGLAFGFPNSNIGQTNGTAPITYVKYNAGKHRFHFGNLLDTTINTRGNARTCLYFTDQLTAQGEVPKYRVVDVQEDISAGPVNKVGVRFIHLSADAGSLACSRVTADGSLASTLSKDVSFGEASDYLYFDSSDVVDGQLRFSVNNPLNSSALLMGVSFIPGTRYAIIISGFLKDQLRTLNDKQFTVSNNLHISLRRIY